MRAQQQSAPQRKHRLPLERLYTHVVHFKVNSVGPHDQNILDGSQHKAPNAVVSDQYTSQRSGGLCGVEGSAP